MKPQIHSFITSNENKGCCTPCPLPAPELKSPREEDDGTPPVAAFAPVQNAGNFRRTYSCPRDLRSPGRTRRASQSSHCTGCCARATGAQGKRETLDDTESCEKSLNENGRPWTTVHLVSNHSVKTNDRRNHLCHCLK